MRFLNSVLLVALAHSAAAAIVPRSATTDATSAAVETVSTEEPATTETAAAETTVAETATEEAAACKSIAEIALADEEGRFKTLMEVVGVTGLLDRFNNTDGTFGNITLFAVINDGFAKLGLDTADITPEDIPNIFSALSLHVVPGSVLSSSLTDGQKVEPYVLGDQLTIGVGPDGAVTVNNANVIEADIEACNGVIHVVDQIITVAPEATGTATETATGTETAAETPAETETATETETETATETATETPTEEADSATESETAEETAAAETTTSS